MIDNIDILAIDDDKFIQKVIIKTLSSSSMSVRTADNGELGIEAAINKPPDIILLDVEMPGINGYEVCDRLRNSNETKEVPIVFLSSHSSLREKMQGYEVGADDYLIKPFEKEHLLARINVLLKFHNERKELREQFDMASKSAMIAMTGASELALAMGFVEKSINYDNINDLAQGFFENTSQLSIDCCAMFLRDDQWLWFSSDEAISPLEKELIEMCDKKARFLDFGSRTIINYPRVCLLVKNMPLDDMERYGRIKDLLPILLSAVNAKINAIETLNALSDQSTNILESTKQIRNSLFDLGSTIVKNRSDSTAMMSLLVQNLNQDFLSMGLEEDQEEYLLNRIDTAIDEAMTEMDAGMEIRNALTFILKNLNKVMGSQEELILSFNESLVSEMTKQSSDMDDNIELF